MKRHRRRHHLAGISLRSAGLAHDLVPPAVGGGLALATTAGIRMYLGTADASGNKVLDPTNTKQAGPYVWAPAIGAGVAAAAGVAMYMMGGPGPALSTALSGAAVAAGVVLSDMITARKTGAPTALVMQYHPAPIPATISGLAAVVPEYANKLAGILYAERMNGVGSSASRNVGRGGMDVSLRGGVGAVNPDAFGKKSFAH